MLPFKLLEELGKSREALAEKISTQKDEWNKKLITAASEGDVAGVTEALAQGADLSYLERGLDSALFKASQAGHLAVVRLLLGKKLPQIEILKSFSLAVLECHNAVVTEFVTHETAGAIIAKEIITQKHVVKTAIDNNKELLSVSNKRLDQVLLFAAHYRSIFSTFHFLYLINMALEAERREEVLPYLGDLDASFLTQTFSETEIAEAEETVKAFKKAMDPFDEEIFKRLARPNFVASTLLELSKETKEACDLVIKIFQRAMKNLDEKIACAMWRLDNNVASSSREYKDIQSIEDIQEFCRYPEIVKARRHHQQMKEFISQKISAPGLVDDVFSTTPEALSFSTYHFLYLIGTFLHAGQIARAYPYLAKLERSFFVFEEGDSTKESLKEADETIMAYDAAKRAQDEDAVEKLVNARILAKDLLARFQRIDEAIDLISAIYLQAMELLDETIACAMFDLDPTLCGEEPYRHIESREDIQEFCRYREIAKARWCRQDIKVAIINDVLGPREVDAIFLQPSPPHGESISISTLHFLYLIKRLVDEGKIEKAYPYLDKLDPSFCTETFSETEIANAEETVKAFNAAVAAKDKATIDDLLEANGLAKNLLQRSTEPMEAYDLVIETYHRAMELSDEKVACAMFAMDPVHMFIGDERYQHIHSIEEVQAFCRNPDPVWRKEQQDVYYAQFQRVGSPLMFGPAEAPDLTRQEIISPALKGINEPSP